VERREPVQVGNFSAVDTSGEADGLVEWMRAQRRGVSSRQADALAVHAGERVLDLGCGPGGDLEVFAAATTAAVGVDLSVAMATAALAHAPVAVANGAGLPFRDGWFDACWSRLVLLHVDEPVAVLAEARRVLRSGARIVAIEPDHGTHVAGPCDVDVFERIRAHRWTKFKHARIGRSLPALLDRVGFVEITARSVLVNYTDFSVARAAGGPFDRAVAAAIEDGAITADEGAAYTASLEEADARGTFFFAALSVIVRATCP
jgi:SAM-dependent methyltransferase